MRFPVDPAFATAVERQRIETLFARMPGAIVSILIGVLLTFVLILPGSSAELMKAWAAFMLTTLALRGWIWTQFRGSIIPPDQIRRWEWACAVAMGLTGTGWAMLCGPLFPDDPPLQRFIWMMLVVIANTGLVLAAASRIAFVFFVIPTLIPALWRFVEVNGSSPATLTATIGCLGVTIVMHQSVRSMVMEHLKKQVEAEQLLAEQQAIFQSATIGIGVFDGTKLIKCNPRFGELFGRGQQAATEIDAIEFFAQPEEAERFLTWATGEFAAVRTARSMERMRRADGSQFWAEISGRRMYYGDSIRDLWMVNEAAMQGSAATRRDDAGMTGGTHNA